MPNAMPEAMLTGCSEQSTQRNVRNGRNVRVQDLSKSSSVPDAAEPVDNGKTGLLICADDHAHGDNATCYVQHKCRCDECREGRAEYEFWRKRMLDAGKELLVDATGSRRRIRALGAIGWSQRMLGDRYGKSPSWFSSVVTKTRVSPSTRDLVVRIYDDLSMTVPVGQDKYQRARITKTRNYARKAGWVPPLGWDDDTIDDPEATPPVPEKYDVLALDELNVQAAIDGHKPELTPPERREVITRLTADGWSTREIAAWIGCASRTVDRIRVELELPKLDPKKIRDQNWRHAA